VERFVRAYQRGCADYDRAFLRRADGRRQFDAFSDEMAALIAKYVYPAETAERGVALTKDASIFIDAQARLDVGDIHRQVAWYKQQNLIDQSVDARAIMDLGFVQGHFNIPA
jgi:NitT/TauT family transport system substrate-binding protein